MIKNIIFDLGQVMVGFDWQDYLRSFHYDKETETVIKNAVFQNPAWGVMDLGMGTKEDYLNIFIKNAPDYAEEITAVYERCPECITKRDYAIPWVEELKAKGYRVYFLSNYPEYIRQGSEDALECTKHMHGGIFSYLVKLVKPDPAIFHCLMDTYPEIKAEESIFFDDNADNIEAAAELGFHAILFKNKAQAENAMQHLIENE